MKKTETVIKEKGFTLIELIVVMAILGILATVGLASFRSSQIKGRDAQRKNDLGQLQRALEAYFNDKGLYPLTADLPSAGAPWQDTLPSGGAGTLYIKEIPSDPTHPRYQYTYRSDGASYKIFAYLENQKDKDIESCSAVTDETCGNESCNYGVSSANVRVCD